MPDYSTPYEAERFRALTRVIPSGSGNAVDIGCHDGTMSNLLADAGYRVIGYDLDPDLLDRARSNHPDRVFRLGTAKDATDVPARQITMCLEVLEHLPEGDQLGFLADIAKGSPGGSWLVLSTPMRHSIVATYERFIRRPWSYRTYDWWDSTHVGVTTWPRLRRLLDETGFEVRTVCGFHFFPFVTPFASKHLPWLGFDLIVLARRR